MKTLLVITQVYTPDPTAVGQYMAEAAKAMAKRGWRVVVLTADRGYDDPKEKFPAREQNGNLTIIRLPFASLGKQTILHRLAGQLTFCLQAFFRGLFLRQLSAVFVTTSPPMGSAVGWALSCFRKVAIKFWVMDINPDQTVILGKAKPDDPAVKVFNWFNRRVLHAAADIIVLDRFMADTIAKKTDSARERMHVMPPWPMESYLERIEHADNPFRKAHGLEGKFVIMYSGNHSMVHPLDTVLEAALRLQSIDSLVFLFIGGGKGKAVVDEMIAKQQPSNIRSLPYQPLDEIKYSLSAADVHLVSMGDPMVGIVHPCKFYGAMSLAKPVLLVGPRESHIGDVLKDFDCGWSVAHGEVDRMEALLRELPALPASELKAKGLAGRQAIEQGLSQAVLCQRLCDILEATEPQ